MNKRWPITAKLQSGTWIKVTGDREERKRSHTYIQILDLDPNSANIYCWASGLNNIQSIYQAYTESSAINLKAVCIQAKRLGPKADRDDSDISIISYFSEMKRL